MGLDDGDVFQIDFDDFMRQRHNIPLLPVDSKVYVKVQTILSEESCFQEDSKEMREFREKKDLRNTNHNNDSKTTFENLGMKVFSLNPGKEREGQNRQGSFIANYRNQKGRWTGSESQGISSQGHTSTCLGQQRRHLGNSSHSGQARSFAYTGQSTHFGQSGHAGSFRHSRQSPNFEHSGTQAGHSFRSESCQQIPHGQSFSSSYSRDPYGQPSKKERKRVGNENDLNRSIIALLNKVSPQNIETIKDKIIKMCIDENDSEQVIKFILRKMHNDYSFIHLYVNILLSIPQQFIPIIKKSCLTLIADFLLTLPETIQKITHDIVGENNLSKFIKAKKQIYDMNKTLCVLIVQTFIEMQPILYLSSLKNLFDQINENKASPEIYDIFINIMYDFFMVHASKELNKDAKPIVTLLLEDKKVNGLCCKRTDFKWNDLLEMLQYNP